MSEQAHVMTVSRNGQVSIPAATRSRWGARRVVVVDLGEHIVIRPLPDDPIGDLEGKYAGHGPSTDELRATARSAAAEHERVRKPRDRHVR